MAQEISEAEAARYARWYATARGRRVDRSERALLAWLLARLPGARRVLEIGCGTGHFTRSLASRGLEALGLDRSAAMLAQARAGAPALPLLCADAHRLPLRDRSVDVTVMITTLEFLASPRQALREAARVSARGIVIVALNRWSAGALSRRWGPRSRGSWLGRARDVSLPGLRRELAEAAGERLRAVHWRSTLLPRPCDGLLVPLPWGDVIGVTAELAEAPRTAPQRAKVRRWSTSCQICSSVSVG